MHEREPVRWPPEHEKRKPMNGPDASADRAFEKAPSCWANASTCHSDKGNPAIGNDFRRLATQHTFGDSWSRPGLDLRTKALISVTIAATLGTRDSLCGQLRIALNNGVTPDEIVELFIHLEAYAGAARASDSYLLRPEEVGAWRSHRRPILMETMASTLGLEGIEAIVFRTVGGQVSLWESLLPDEVLRLPAELARVDGLLDDPVFSRRSCRCSMPGSVARRRRWRRICG
jgi:4-carboxymuconolactone decarboxylase